MLQYQLNIRISTQNLPNSKISRLNSVCQSDMCSYTCAFLPQAPKMYFLLKILILVMIDTYDFLNTSIFSVDDIISRFDPHH